MDAVPNIMPLHTLVAESWNYVQLEAIKFSYIWTCAEYVHNEDIESMTEGGDTELTSPMFSYGVNDEPKFNLIFKFGGDDLNDDKYYSMYLKLVSSHKNDVEAQFKFAFINANGEKVNEMESKGICLFRPGQSNGRRKFMQCDHFRNNDSLIDNNILRIFCEVTVYQKSVLFEAPKSSLSDDLGHLVDDEEFSDVTLSVNGYDYKVHKNILSARSPVFAAMFKSETEERSYGKVIITDVDNDVLKEMLRFIYTGRSLSLNNMAEELLIAADKYQLETLKGECQETLRMKLSIANAPKILVLAEELRADQLKSRTIDFITTHVSDVMETAAFQNLFNTHPQLIEEAFRALATKSMPNTPEL